MRKHLKKASPEKGVSKLAAWTTANSAVLDVEWFDSTHGNSQVNQPKLSKSVLMSTLFLYRERRET